MKAGKSGRQSWTVCNSIMKSFTLFNILLPKSILKDMRNPIELLKRRASNTTLDYGPRSLLCLVRFTVYVFLSNSLIGIDIYRFNDQLSGKCALRLWLSAVKKIRFTPDICLIYRKIGPWFSYLQTYGQTIIMVCASKTESRNVSSSEPLKKTSIRTIVLK